MSEMQITGNATAVIVVLVALLTGGMVSIAVALRLTGQLVHRRWRGRVVEGTVTRNIDVGSGGPESALEAEVEFTDPDAGVVQIRSRGRGYPAQFEVGRRVRVTYVVGEPRDARIVEELQAGALWLGVLGVTLALVAALMLINVWNASPR